MRFFTRLRIGIQSCDFVSYTEDATIVDQNVEKCCLSKMRRIPLKEQKLTTDIIIRIAQADFLLNLVIILHYQCNNNWPLVAGITYFYFNTLVVITIKIEII